MKSSDFLALIWRRQGEGYGFISVRAGATSWYDQAIRVGRKKILVPDKEEGDIYFTPNLFSGPRRRKELMQASRWLYADLDRVSPYGLGDCEPNVALESSPDSFQALWLLRAALEPDEHQKLNKRLTYHLNADKGGWDATQVLRVPGTYNYKYDGEPTVKLLWMDNAIFYPPDMPEVSQNGHNNVEFVPTSLTPRQILKVKNINGGIRTKLLARAPSGDRSKVLYRLECALLAHGLSPGEVFVVLKPTVWNKFNDEGLKADIARAATRA